MDARNLIRWSGMTLLVGGVLWLSAILHPPDTLEGMLSPAYAPSHYVTAAACMLLVYGLIGLYARQAARAGWLGLAAFILTSAATAMLATAEVFSGALAPNLAANLQTQWLVDPHQTGPFVIVIGAIAVLDIVGNSLLGVTIMLARVLSPWAGLFIIIGFTFLAIGIVPPGPRVVAHLGILLSGLGYVWCGYGIWAASRPSGPQAAPGL